MRAQRERQQRDRKHHPQPCVQPVTWLSRLLHACFGTLYALLLATSMQLSQRAACCEPQQLLRLRSRTCPAPPGVLKPCCLRRRPPIVRCHDSHQFKSGMLRGDAQEVVDAKREGWDVSKEQARRFRRTVYTFLDWKRHRSSRRYTRHFSTFVESWIVKALLRPVLSIVAFAACIMLLQQAHINNVLPTWVPHLPALPMEPFNLTSFALSLLLVFRTNSSYSRWEEGRRRFGDITTGSRDVARQAFALLPASELAVKAKLGRWLVALCRCAAMQLREGTGTVRQNLADVLPPNELRGLEQAASACNCCLQVVSGIVASSSAPPATKARIDESISLLVHALSSCERILSTPIPLAYTRHTSRYLIMWLVLLPLALCPLCGWWSIPAVAVMSFIMLGIEEIGVQIEEPFSILALDFMVTRAEANINSMLRDLTLADQLATQGLVPSAGGSTMGGSAGGEQPQQQRGAGGGHNGQVPVVVPMAA